MHKYELEIAQPQSEYTSSNAKRMLDRGARSTNAADQHWLDFNTVKEILHVAIQSVNVTVQKEV